MTMTELYKPLIVMHDI